MTALLRVRGARKTFPARPTPVRALDGLDLDVPVGAVAAILGPSGCGKTTLLRTIAGFETLDAGSVTIDERLVTGPGTFVAPERRGVGVVPQEGALFPHLSVAANIGFGLPRAERPARVTELLELVGMPGYARRMPHELSGGEQQRIALARALANRPALVLLDEPFSALDAGLRASLREEVRATLRRAGATALLVTHDQEEALSMADLVAVMRAGQVVQAADPITLYTDPVDLGVAAFVGDSVVLPARFADGFADTALGRLELRHPVSPGPGQVVIRPEQLELSAVTPANGKATTDAAGVTATVESVSFFGHDALVHLHVPTYDASAALALSARLHARRVPQVGELTAVRVTGRVTGFAAEATPVSLAG